MQIRLAYLAAFTLVVAGCATSQPQYEVSPDNKRQKRTEAERTHASRVPVMTGTTTPISSPRVLSSVFPGYPDQLARAGIVGNVVVQFTIGTDGVVRNATVLGTPSPELVALSLQAIEQWKFAPATSDGKPVSVIAQQEFVFKVE